VSLEHAVGLLLAILVLGYLRVCVNQIRRKLEPDPARPRYSVTEARVGYRFEPPDA
jgi:DNA-binding response OmpR family regulator